MAKRVQSKRSLAQRQADNRGVAHGTVRSGRGGRALRRYDAKTARWTAIGTRDSASVKTKNVSPPSSAGSARTSTGTPGAVSGRFPSQWNARQQRAASRRQQTVRSAATTIAGGGPAVAAARYGVTQVTKRLPKVDAGKTAGKALDFGSRAARTSGKALSRWWSGY